MRESMIYFIALLCLYTGLAMPAQAQGDEKYPVLNDRYRIYLGGFFPNVESEIAINGATGNPPPLDAEGTLGIEDSDSVLWGGARWRISRRNQLEFEFFKLNRDGFVNAVPDPIEVGDFLIESGSIGSAFDLSLGRLTYGFSLARNERMDVQIKAGLHIAEIDVRLLLGGNICDVSMGEMSPCPGSVAAAESQDITAPLPHFGGSFAYAFSPRLTGRFQVIGFALEIDSIDGSLVEVDVDVNWNPWRHFGFGAGIRYFNVEIEATSSDLDGKFEFDYFGPVIYFETTF